MLVISDKVKSKSYIYTKMDQNIIGFEICKTRNHTDNSMYKVYVGVGVHTNMKMYRNI